MVNQSTGLSQKILITVIVETLNSSIQTMIEVIFMFSIEFPKKMD